MFDDLQAYFYENVATTCKEYFEVGSSGQYGVSRGIRAARAAATPLYHLREHIPTPLRKTRREFAAKCQDYDPLGDIVNAAKHHTLTLNCKHIADAGSIFEHIVVPLYHDSQRAWLRQEFEHLFSQSTRPTLPKPSAGEDRVKRFLRVTDRHVKRNALGPDYLSTCAPLPATQPPYRWRCRDC